MVMIPSDVKEGSKLKAYELKAYGGAFLTPLISELQVLLDVKICLKNPIFVWRLEQGLGNFLLPTTKCQ